MPTSKSRIRWRSHRREHRMAGGALKLQAKEYERRLEALNHENARILSAQETYLRIDNFDAAHKELLLHVDTMARELGQRIDTQVEAETAAQRSLAKRVTDLELANKELVVLTEERRNTTLASLADRNRRTTITMWLIGLAVTIISISVSVALTLLK